MLQWFCCSVNWKDVGNFQVYQSIKEGEERQKIVSDSCTDVTVINDTEHQLVVANGLTDTIIVNTDDAVYVSDSKQVNEIKKIIARESCKFPSYLKKVLQFIGSGDIGKKFLLEKLSNKKSNNLCWREYFQPYA